MDMVDEIEFALVVCDIIDFWIVPEVDYSNIPFLLNFKIHPTTTDERIVEEVDLNVSGDMVGAYGGHGGGDERLSADFVSFVRGEKPSLACTSIFDSVAGHLCVYLADKSRENNGMPQEVIL